MTDVSKFDGLAAAARERFGRPVAELTRDELTGLYRDAGIMPPRRPKLSLVPESDDPEPDSQD